MYCANPVGLVDDISSPNYTEVGWFVYDLVQITWCALQEEIQMTRKMVYYKYSPYESYVQHGIGHYFDLSDTLRSLKEEIRICKTDNEKIMEAQEK